MAIPLRLGRPSSKQRCAISEAQLFVEFGESEIMLPALPQLSFPFPRVSVPEPWNY